MSILAFAPSPLISAYSDSNAAAFSLTQSLRAPLAACGVRVHAVMTGPVDTGTTQGLDIPEGSPVRRSRHLRRTRQMGEDIFPDPMSAAMACSWSNSAAKALERQNAALTQAAPASSELLTP